MYCTVPSIHCLGGKKKRFKWLSVFQLACWFYPIAYLRVKPPICQCAVTPVMFLMLQPVLEGILASCPLPHCTSLLPLRLKLASICEIQYPMAVKPGGKGRTVMDIHTFCAFVVYIPFLKSPMYFVPVGNRNSPFPSILKINAACSNADYVL